MIGAIKRGLKRWGVIAFGMLLLGQAGASEQITYFHNDALGSPLVATNSSGDVAWKESYRPYGEQVQKPAAGENNQRWFAGKPFDKSTGLSYSGARYYNLMLGRFMGIDPIGFDPNNLHSFNRYAYANNNPYKFVDPDGRTPVHAIAFVVGFGIDAGTQYLVNGNVDLFQAGIAGLGAAATGGVGMLFARQAAMGAITTGQAIRSTAFVGGSIGAATSASADIANGRPLDYVNAGINAFGGSVGAGGGAKIGAAGIKRMENLAKNSDGILNHIAETTRSANVGKFTIGSSMGQASGAAAVEFGVSTATKTLEIQPMSGQQNH